MGVTIVETNKLLGYRRMRKGEKGVEEIERRNRRWTIMKSRRKGARTRLKSNCVCYNNENKMSLSLHNNLQYDLLSTD